MKGKYIASFFIGFVVTALATAWLYRLWRQKREIMPEPLALRRAPAPESRSGAAEPAKVTPDRLETIRGIGPIYARRLNEAGIFTYAQLAALTPEQLQSIVEATRWDPAEWIDAAKQLSAG